MFYYMDTNFTKLLSVLTDISAKYENIHDELERIHSNCVIINKQQAHNLIDDFDYVMQCVRDSVSGQIIDWEKVVCELGFRPYSVINEIKKQI